MPINLTHVKQQRNAVTVTYAGETAKVEYNPDALSNREMREIRKRAQNGKGDDDDEDFNLSLASRLIVDWDLVESGKNGHAKPLPVTKESLDSLPPRLLGAIVQAITEDMYPQPATETTSGGSF